MNCKDDCLNYDWCKNANGCTDFYDEDDFIVYDVENECGGFKNKADFAEVKHGEWIYKNTYYEADNCNCSLCSQNMTTAKGTRMNYCPNCGAKMDGTGAKKPTIENIVKVGDIVRVEDIHSDAPHFYEVSRIEKNGVVSQPASFKHWFIDITAVYRYDGKNFECIWGLNNER